MTKLKLEWVEKPYNTYEAKVGILGTATIYWENGGYKLQLLSRKYQPVYERRVKAMEAAESFIQRKLKEALALFGDKE